MEDGLFRRVSKNMNKGITNLYEKLRINVKKAFKKKQIPNWIYYITLILLAVLFLLPFYIVLISSFKTKSMILENPFMLPNSLSLRYYIEGVRAVNYFGAFFLSLFITVVSVGLILLSTSMTSWIIVRVKNRFTKILYYMFLISMVVPFQLVMYPMVYVASNWFNLDNAIGINFIYLGFGSGLAVFLFTGFIKGIPYEIEEAATVDGCNPIQIFFYIIVPVLKPTFITVAILNTMWIWNDFLLPYTVLPSDLRTIPVAINYLIGSYGEVDYSKMTALITLSIIPIIIFYVSLQKYIIKGVSEGAIKS